MNIGNKVRPKERIRADHHNGLIDDIRKAMNIRSVSSGLKATWNPSGIDIGITGSLFDWFVPARITAVYGSDPDLPANVTYDVAGLLEDQAKLINATPFYGRPVKGNDKTFTKIRPAAVGSFCFILRDRDVEGTVTAKLVLLPGGSDGECLFYEACSASPAIAAPDGGPSMIRTFADAMKGFFGFSRQ